VPNELKGSASFFNNNPATKWHFAHYVKGAHNGVKEVKNYNPIKAHYLNDLYQISQLQNMPQEILNYIVTLKEDIVCIHSY
jgi:hypothetical protein